MAKILKGFTEFFKSPKVENEEGAAIDEWVGMPEFVQDKNEPFSKITIRFETEEDLVEFAKLIGQQLTPKTKSIWHPFKPHRSGLVRRWVDEYE